MVSPGMSIVCLSLVWKKNHCSVHKYVRHTCFLLELSFEYNQSEIVSISVECTNTTLALTKNINSRYLCIIFILQYIPSDQVCSSTVQVERS